MAKTDDAADDEGRRRRRSLVDAMRGLEYEEAQRRTSSTSSTFRAATGRGRRSPRRGTAAGASAIVPSPSPPLTESASRAAATPGGGPCGRTPELRARLQRRSLGFRTPQCAFPRVTRGSRWNRRDRRPRPLLPVETGREDADPRRGARRRAGVPPAEHQRGSTCAGCGTCRSQGRGGILADDMGLRKTLQVAAFAAGLLRSRAAPRAVPRAHPLLRALGQGVRARASWSVNLFKYAGGGSARRARQGAARRRRARRRASQHVRHGDTQQRGARRAGVGGGRRTRDGGNGRATPSRQDMPARARAACCGTGSCATKGTSSRTPPRSCR